jgi:uncharacterized Zn finger protein (UPF0148 family)
MHLVSIHCPTCGAPIQLHAAEQRHAICVYCSSSVVLRETDSARVTEDPSTSKAETAEVGSISKAEIAEVIALLASGEMDAAVSRYAELARVGEQEAIEMIAALPTLSKRKLMNRSPINSKGLLKVGAIQLALLGGACALFANHLVWAVVLLVLALLWLKMHAPHLSATIVHHTGDRGVATIERSAVVCRNHKVADIVVLGMTVYPEDQSEAFYDEETLLVIKRTVEKLQPGNKIPVRFNRRRQMVFPLSPITVVGTR